MLLHSNRRRTDSRAIASKCPSEQKGIGCGFIEDWAIQSHSAIEGDLIVEISATVQHPLSGSIALRYVALSQTTDSLNWKHVERSSRQYKHKGALA